MSRDTAKRGYSASQVQDLLERREKVSEKFIRPQREHADMVVRFRPGPHAIDDTKLHATLAMRDQGRHPALPIVIEESPLAARRLELRRKGAGAVLEIDGRITDEESAQAEQALMRQRPELQAHPSASYGTIHNAMACTHTAMRSGSRSCSSPIP